MVSDNQRAAEKTKPDPLVRNFLDYLRVEKGLAQLTVEAYLLDVEQFASFLTEKHRKLEQAWWVLIRTLPPSIRDGKRDTAGR